MKALTHPLQLKTPEGGGLVPTILRPPRLQGPPGPLGLPKGAYNFWAPEAILYIVHSSIMNNSY